MKETILKKGDKVSFKGNSEFKALNKTYIAAVSFHEMVFYHIEHPNGDYTKQKYKRNSGFPDGFEGPHSSNFEEGKKYIWAIPCQIELLNNKTDVKERMKQGE